MEMKWNPIVNGDLSEVPLFDDVLFTIIDNLTGDSYVIYDELDLTYAKENIAVFNKWGCLNRSEKVLAWAELPEPFEPGRCDMCKHNEQWTDCFGDRWSKCKFSERMFTKGCPTEKEVD